MLTIVDQKNNRQKGERKMLAITDAIRVRIQDILDRKRMSVYQLARLSGLTQSTVNEVMTGQSKFPRIITIVKIAKALDMDLPEFFGDKVFENVVEAEIDQVIKSGKKS